MAVALRLEGPLQAWGTWCVGDDRPTQLVPTRSGVLGLVACCMGIDRRQTPRLVDLHRRCRVHIRVDRPGTVMIDDQTIQGLDRVKMGDGAGRASGTRATIQSKRSYLADAAFSALVEAEAELCAEIARAIESPWFVPFLGRRSCVPSAPLLALAPPSVLEESDGVLAMFDRVPLGEAALHSTSSDVFVDGELSDSRTLRVLRQRDELVGPLPRQFGTRSMTHLRLARPDAPPVSDTVDPWMPT